MIKKITNWTFGSIFRTIGRFLAYIIIGIIISLIFIKKDYIKAAEIVIPVQPTNYSLYYNTGASSGFDCASQNYCDDITKKIYLTSSASVVNDYVTINNTDTSPFDYIEFTFAITQANANYQQDVSSDNYVCTVWQENNGIYTCTNVSNFGSDQWLNNILNNSMFMFKVDYSDLSGVESVCTVSGNTIVCPTLRHNINKIYINSYLKTSVNAGSDISFNFYLSRRLKPYISNSTAEAIQNQTQQYIQAQENATQQQIEANQVCTFIDKNMIIEDNSTLQNNGNIVSTTTDGITDYIRITDRDILKLVSNENRNKYACFYNINKTLISCIITGSQLLTPGQTITIPTNASYFRASIYKNSNRPTFSLCQNGNQAMSNAINGEVSGSGVNGTVTDEDAMNNSCGIICKLKHLISMFSLDNLKYLIVPTEEQMNDLFEQMQTKITSKIGIMGLPITVYTRLMQIAMQYDDSQQNWCLQWNAVPVPNFEDYNIIESGQWCFSDILENQTMNTFRNACITIIGGLILLSFIQYLYNCLHRILDVPIQDNYEYFTVENVYGINPETGEVQSHDYRERTTTRR